MIYKDNNKQKMLSLKQMRYGGEGRYRTLLFSKQSKHMDEDETKKYNRVVDFIDQKYPGCYNPLRAGEDYICFSCHNYDNAQHTKNDCYDLTFKIQSYEYNDTPKLRIVLTSSTKVEGPKKITIQYNDINFDEAV